MCIVYGPSCYKYQFQLISIFNLRLLRVVVRTLTVKMKLFILISLLYIIDNAQSLEKELTVFIDPGTENCFYQNAKQGESIEIEYQVIDGGHGDLDITFRLVDPNGRILLADFKKSENNHRYDVEIPGDFRFCFDNSFSSYNMKTVFFELIIYRDEEDGWGSDEKFDFNAIDDNQNYDIGIEDVQEIINNMRDHLTKVRNLQELIKSTEARDRNVAEENFFKVNTFSMAQLALMIIVGFIQVIMVRSLFDDQSRVHKFWRNLAEGLR